jgi:mono/diheme cytochrome c family protein
MKKILALALLVSTFAASAAFAATAADNWDNNCSKCHGADGSASGKIGKKLKIKDYTDASVQASMKDEDMVKAIKDGVKDANGKDRMPSFKADLSDAEATDLVAYIRKMKK